MVREEIVTPFPMFPTIGKGQKFKGYTMGELQRQLNVFEQAKQYIYEQLKSDSLKPVIDSQTFPLKSRSRMLTVIWNLIGKTAKSLSPSEPEFHFIQILYYLFFEEILL